MIGAFKELKKSVGDKYKVILETSGERHEGQGDSVDEAIASLNLSWEQITAKGVITVFKGKGSMEQLFYPKQLRRIFANKLTRLLWAKRLETLFTDKHGNNL